VVKLGHLLDDCAVRHENAWRRSRSSLWNIRWGTRHTATYRAVPHRQIQNSNGPFAVNDGVQRPGVWHKLQGISLISNISTVTDAGNFYEMSIFDPYSIGMARCLLHWACY
jgi:hypothetical protein